MGFHRDMLNLCTEINSELSKKKKKTGLNPGKLISKLLFVEMNALRTKPLLRKKPALLIHATAFNYSMH